jgi:hypothetical protein
MRVYLPTTVGELRTLRAEGALPGRHNGRAGHAVTAAVREWYVSGDTEELEHSALTDAAESSLRLIAGELITGQPAVRSRRAVLAADLPEPLVTVGGASRSEVTVTGPVALAEVASILLDEVEAEAAVRAAIEALPAADQGDDDALFLLDEAQACDLLWYDVSELDHLELG